MTAAANAWRVRVLAQAEAGGGQGKRRRVEQEIVTAAWGMHGHAAEVTGAVSRQVSDGRLDFAVTNEALGGQDPIPGTPKVLTIKYRLNGREATRQFKESDRAVLP